MRLLVLGGTRFVGRAAVAEALARGHAVTTVNRGRGAVDLAPVEALRADRGDVAGLRAVLGDREWDAVIDTWSGPPRAVRDSVTLLAGRVGHYGYVSSRSVYRSLAEPDRDERAPLVDADPADTTDADYARAKRGAELAVLDGFGERGLLARAGLVLGPHENIGRLPWWLARMERGGDVLAPGPADRPLQCLDARDLAAWLLDCAQRGLGGAYNVVSRPGHTTMGRLLAAAKAVTGSDARLVWATPEAIAAAGVEPWTELPIWVPPTGNLVGLHSSDVSAAIAAGLTCRPIEQTVADTWRWLRADGYPTPPPGRPPVGLDPARERAVLAVLAALGGAGGAGEAGDSASN